MQRQIAFIDFKRESATPYIQYAVVALVMSKSHPVKTREPNLSSSALDVLHY